MKKQHFTEAQIVFSLRQANSRTPNALNNDDYILLLFSSS